MRETLALAVAYGIGSIPFALLVARAAGGLDPRRVGSGNLGATNVMRAAGWSAGLFTLVLDVLKGAAAVWVARRAAVSEAFVSLAGLLAIVGHIAPVWLGFHGGKGVATAAGVFILLAPRLTLVAALAFIIVAALTRRVSLGSLAAALALAAAPAIDVSRHVAGAAVVTAILIVWMHRANIARVWAGTEPRIGSRV